MDEKTKRVLKPQVEEVMMRSQSSVSIKRDSKGQVNAELKAYADTAAEAVDVAVREWNKLSKLLEEGEKSNV